MKQPLYFLVKTATNQGMIEKIVSGGQTGVDQAGLDAAIFLQIEHGGWCPRGRLSEDGVIPPQYQLTETASRKYQIRTEQNVIDSSGTLILYWDSLQGGTKLTYAFARKHARPCLSVNLNDNPSIDDVTNWIVQQQIKTMNVAGPRESTWPGIGDVARQFLIAALQENS